MRKALVRLLYGAMVPVVTRDAIVIVPGIMGSELVDTRTRRPLWGFTPRTLTSILDDGLRLTDAERGGDYRRVKATGLLRLPAWMPILRGFDTYTALLRAVRQTALHWDAILQHAYDWRLPISHNAQELRRAALAHLAQWRQRCPEARLVVIAHSMGGLLTRGARFSTAEVRACVTLGTPFGGSVKAIQMLSPSSGLRGRLSSIAHTLPGLYDLLPWTRTVVDDGVSARQLEVADIGALGGDTALAQNALRYRQRLAGVVLPGHRQLIGYSQPTPQSIRLHDGTATPLNYKCAIVPTNESGISRIDEGGDGTVARSLATLDDVVSHYLAQQHSSMPAADDALRQIIGVLTEAPDPGEPLGDGALGLDLPCEAVRVGVEFLVTVTGISHPRRGGCHISHAATGNRISRPALEIRDGSVVAPVRLPAPGLYQVHVQAPGGSPISQFVFADAA